MLFFVSSVQTPSWAFPWWGTMVGINIINVALGILIFIRSKNADQKMPETAKYRKRMRKLGIIFVSVAMYRSIFVSSYPQRIAWFQTMANSPILIRSLAFFAELSFAALIMFSLLHLNKEVPLPREHANHKILNFLETKTPYVFFICLFLAQFFAIGGLFTQYLVLFAIEETLWALAYLFITPLVVIQFKRVFSNKDTQYKKEMKLYRVFLIIMMVYNFGYLIYQFVFSLPLTYYSQLTADFAKPHPELMQGIKDAIFNFTATRDFQTWGGWGFFIWHSAYFSLVVWMVLFYMNGPRKLKND